MGELLSRKLAVMLHADVVGSTSLVQKDESLAHQRIQDAFRRLSNITREYGGVAHEVRGDALVAEFARASDAVCAALAFQSANSAGNADLCDDLRPELRVGISLGEVVVADGTVTGPGVVLAQRLEQLAEPNGVVVQGSVSETVPTRMPFEFRSLGEQLLKGFDQPVRAFATYLGAGAQLPTPESTTSPREIESISKSHPDKPSIAVLPFRVIGGNADAESLADGMMDVVINTLARTEQSEIADRASVLVFKEQSPGLGEVAQKLGVQYVLQGNVQQSGQRLRITVELFDSVAKSHVWSERFDRTLLDPFELQDDIAKRITQSVRSVIVYGVDWEVQTDSFDAWLLNIQGVERYFKGSAEENHRARKLFEEVVKFDPQFAFGPCNLAWTHVFDCLYGWSRSPEKSAADALNFARQICEIDPRNTFPFKTGTLAVATCLNGDYDRAVELADQSLSRNPDEPCSMGWSTGWVHCLSGNLEYSLELLERSDRLFKNPPWNISEYLGLCYLVNGQSQGAVSAFDQAGVLAHDPSFALALKAAAHVELNELDRAQLEMRRALHNRPRLSLRDFRYYLAFRDRSLRERISQALVRAGLAQSS